MGAIEEDEFLTFLSRCGKRALANERNPRGVDIQAFIAAVKAAQFSQSQLETRETSEDMILARHLNVPTAKTLSTERPTGFRDVRYGVEVPEGFEIFRTFRGTDYRAKATGGKWLLMSTGDTHASLNELSRAIGANSENAWVNWFYSDAKGERIVINTLRDESKIVQRPSFLRRF